MDKDKPEDYEFEDAEFWEFLPLFMASVENPDDSKHIENCHEWLKSKESELDIKPCDAPKWNNLANMYGVFLQEHHEAKRLSTNAIKSDPAYLDGWLDLSKICITLRDYDEAVEASREVIKLDDESIEGWGNLSIALGHQNKHSAAADAAKKSTELAPDDARSWHQLGWALLNWGRPKESEAALEKSNQLDPTNLDVWRSLTVARGRQNKLQLAESTAFEATELFPDDPLNWENLGISRYKQSYFEGSEEAFLQAIHNGSATPDIWLNIGNSRKALGNFYQAEDAFMSATELDDSVAVCWSLLGSVRLALGKYAGARDALLRAVNLEQQSSIHHEELGAVFLNLLALGQAKNAFKNAIKYATDDGRAAHMARVFYLLGITELLDDNYGSAEHSLKDALELAPSTVDITETVHQAECWLGLGWTYEKTGRPKEAEFAFRKAVTLGSSWSWRALRSIANLQIARNEDSIHVLRTFRRMSKAIEEFRSEQLRWQDRLGDVNPAVALEQAADFAVQIGPDYHEDALKFAIQSKARVLGELYGHKPDELFPMLSEVEKADLETLDRQLNSLEADSNIPDSPMIYEHESTGPRIKLEKAQWSPEKSAEWNQKKQGLDEQYRRFFEELVEHRPELEPFVRGPLPKPLEFSLPRLRRKLKKGDGVLEFLFVPNSEQSALMGFLITNEGLIKTDHRNQDFPIREAGGLKLTEWLEEVRETLHIEDDSRAEGIEHDLTSAILARWGEILYGPFIDDLNNIKRLRVCPHSFLTQLPFNAIPFPDGVEREVAILPSAASLTRPSPRNPRPEPRFTLGVVAADALEQAPLDLQSEEVRHLRGTVKSASRRWELADNRVGEEPTLANIQDRVGLTKCLVLSCHGRKPNEDWGTLYLGTSHNPEPVTGRQLVERVLMRGQASKTAMDIVITSACLTGQIDTDRYEEWLGLPMALQSVWKTKAMLLTLWEVEELPAMIWVVELVKALTQGLSAGEAQKIAQGKVRSTTVSDVQVKWLPTAQKRLSKSQWQRVNSRWNEATKSASQYPFSAPMHWAPFILVGDPRVTVSPKRSSI